MMVGTVSRRAVLQGGLAAAAAMGLSAGWSRRGLAQQPLTLGEAKIVVLSDGNLMLPLSFSYPNAPQEELKALLAAEGLPTDALQPDCNVTYMQVGDRHILFDAGSGPNFMPTAGELLTSLEEAGLSADDITDVIFTHAHPDHLWGIVDDFDEVPFPNATMRMNGAELDFWRADGTLEAMPEERKTFVVGAQARLAAIEERLEAFKPGEEIAPGVEVIDTGGHTPGHVSFAIHGGSESLVILGDAITHHVISFEKPDWPSGSDQDSAKGAATRAALLDRLAADKSRVVGFHLPYPGHGMVEKTGTAYRFAAQG